VYLYVCIISQKLGSGHLTLFWLILLVISNAQWLFLYIPFLSPWVRLPCGFCEFFSRSCCFSEDFIYSFVLRYSITMFGHVARDMLLAIKGQLRCKLDQCVRDTVSRLSLRRRGCRAGEHCRRRRRLAAETSSRAGLRYIKGPRLDTFMGPLLPSSSLPSFSYPHWSCSVSPTCHSAWQQSVAVFNKLWKQKLINNFNYCLPKH